MQASESPHLFPDTFYTTSIDSWAAAIQRVPLEAKQCVLDQIVHYKALSDMEHEFLVVYASHRPSGTKIVLGVDRDLNRQEFVDSSQGKSPSPTLSSKSLRVSPALPLRWSLSALVFLSESLSESSSYDISPHMAYDGMQVSHDGTPAPILAHHGPCVALSNLTFSKLSHSSTSTAGSDSDSDSHAASPSLLHLSVLLLTIRAHFPDYTLLQHQCYFFARVTCLALIDLFGCVETKLEDGWRAATWRGVHVSVYSAGHNALQNVIRHLPLSRVPTLIVPAGFYVVYSAVRLCDGNVVESEMDRRRISDEKIRELPILHKYRVAWRSFEVEDSELSLPATAKARRHDNAPLTFLDCKGIH